MAAPTVRGRTTFGTGLSVTSPVATAIGDMVIVVSYETRQNTTAPTHTLDSGNGYVEIVSNGNYTETNLSGRLSVAYKIATSAGANTYQAYTSSDGTTVRTCCIVLTVGTFSLNAIAQASTSATTNGAPDCPNVTLGATRDWIVIACGGWCYSSANANTAGAPTNYSNLQQYSTAGTAAAATAERTLTGPASENPATYTDNTAPTGTTSVTVGIGSNISSVSPSASVSPSSSTSPSFSVSPSPSVSPSASVSPSTSESPSLSPSASQSPSISPSASQSPSSSASPSGPLVLAFASITSASPHTSISRTRPSATFSATFAHAVIVSTRS